MSFFVILPKSPWEQSLADIEKAGVPTEENVDAILEAIKPLFPTPAKITFDWQFAITSTALLKEELIYFFNFFRPLISSSITFLAIFFKSFLI